MSEPQAVTAISWLLELPFDLGMPKDAGALIGSTTISYPGWEGAYDRLPGWHGLAPDYVPLRGLRFRRAKVGIGMPTESTDRAYGELRDLSRFARLRYRRGLRRLARRGVREWKTVCQLTKWYAGDELPEPPLDHFDPDEDSGLRSELMELLGDLDLWLRAYAVTAGKMEIQSLVLHDLPAMVPMLVEVQEGPDRERIVRSGVLAIHRHVPDLIGAEHDVRAAEVASRLLLAGSDAFSFFEGFSLLFQAQSHAAAGRARQAVIDMGTAIESLVTQTVEGALRAHGTDESEVSRILGRRWRDLYNKELPGVLGVTPGQAGKAHSDRWRDGYSLRVEVVHHGAPATQPAALKAVSLAWDLIAWMGERARESPELAEMGDALRVVHH